MIEKPISRLIQILEAQSFSIIGNPGVDGVGVSARMVYESAVAQAEGDFIVTLGDISPMGRVPYYRNASISLNQFLDKPMYMVPGLNDGPAFEEFFGPRNKAILAEDFTLVMLDNSDRHFSDESLTFMRDTLAIAQSANIVVAFHFPPPNRIGGDSVSLAEWSRFEEAAGVWRKRISLLVASRCRSYFEDEIDGLRLIVTGGGGGTIHDMERVARPPHHLVEFSLDEHGNIKAECKPVAVRAKPDRTGSVEKLLRESFRTESQAYTHAVLDALEADYQGKPNLARLFRVIAESTLSHARNLRRIMNGPVGPDLALEKALEGTNRGNSEQAAAMAAEAENSRDYLALQSFHNGLAADIVNSGLMEKARCELETGNDIEATDYFVCSSCGIVFSGFEAPDNCSECGAPMELIPEVE